MYVTLKIIVNYDGGNCICSKLYAKGANFSIEYKKIKKTSA